MTTPDPLRAALHRLHQYAETNPEHNTDEIVDAACAALDAVLVEVEPDPLQAALDRIRVAAEQANAAFKPLAELLSSLAAAAPADGPAVPEGREPAAVDGEPSDEELLDIWDTGHLPSDEDLANDDGEQDLQFLFTSAYYESLENDPSAMAEHKAKCIRAVFNAGRRWGRPAAPADGPAVPEGREPAAVASEASPAAPAAPAAGEAGELATWLQSQASHHEAAGTQWARHLARAATLLRQLRHPAPPDAGEVGELVAWLYRLADERTCNRRRGIRPHPSALTRAATLLERLSAQAHAPALQPVAISERPWKRPGWRDSNGRCWFGAPQAGAADAKWILRRPSERLSYQTVSLPASALPLPTATTTAGQEGT